MGNACDRIPEISDYTPEEILSARTWPAINRYLDLITLSAQSFADQLRIDRHRFWLKCALATFHNKAHPRDICFFWSRVSEELVLRAWKQCGGEELPICLLALGKLGSEELNLSSDIDLIAVRSDQCEPSPKVMREFQTLLGEHTAFGFAFRVDLNLRPGGRFSTLVPSQSEFENHYGYHGEMWERLAYVRMRILAGPLELSQNIQTFSRKFSFRKHLDYTLLEDLKTLRGKIRQEWFPKTPQEFHLKLGTGGIREIELFTHSLQVMHGGRNPQLQTHSTTMALTRIHENGVFPRADAEFLLTTYWYLRELENRLHAYEDQQNYLLFKNKPSLTLPSGTFEKLKQLRERSTALIDSLLGTESSSSPSLPSELDKQKKWLKELGFSSTSIEETWPELVTATAVSKRTEQDEKARQIFLQQFILKLVEIHLDKDLGLSLLTDFVKATRAKASFFTLLNHEPRLLEDLAWLFSTSPYLGNLIASRPELIDSYLLRAQSSPPEDMNLLLEDLTERRLLAELISANRFLSDRDLNQMCGNLSTNADEICLLLLERLKKEYGSSSLSLLAMGKWGGKELGLRSDLDFVFVTFETPTPIDQKIAKRFLSRMTEAHKGGSIYPIDMRLRPSGHAGPILVSSAQLEDHLSKTAAAWERQAYLRSRKLGDLNLNPAALATRRGLSPDDLDELRMIREKLFLPSSSEIDLKLDHGGLAQIEFAAQISLLARREFSLDPSTQGMIQYLKTVDERWQKVATTLLPAYSFLRTVEQLYQLTTSQSGSKLRPKSDTFARLAMIFGVGVTDLEQQIRSACSSVKMVLESVDELSKP